MNTTTRQSHWDGVYTLKSETAVSWFQATPAVSLNIIQEEHLPPDAAIMDVGGGASLLVDSLLGEGFNNLSVLDVSARALEMTRARLGGQGKSVQLICADITTWQPASSYRLWHDRAVFHFLTEDQDRQAYIEALRQAVVPGGRVIIASFALDGPEKCSGLPVCRYSHASLAAAMGEGFSLMGGVMEDHATPSGKIQKFQYTILTYNPVTVLR
jgi:SAM-dependent methyltransferase